MDDETNGLLRLGRLTLSVERALHFTRGRDADFEYVDTGHEPGAEPVAAGAAEHID